MCAPSQTADEMGIRGGGDGAGVFVPQRVKAGGRLVSIVRTDTCSTLPAAAWTLGQALLDHRDPTRVRHRLDRPFLRSEKEWEVKGFTGNAVVANGLVPFKGEWLLYYGAADHHIGLATCRMAAARTRRSFS
jgi:predicted GH43/DUF377 family glycosyl hydrolase